MMASENHELSLGNLKVVLMAECHVCHLWRKSLLLLVIIVMMC